MKRIYFIIILLGFALCLRAAENIAIRSNAKPLTQDRSLGAPCSAATSSIDLDINNVRAIILVGGDMWWDLNNARYEVPQGQGKHAIFAGSLWIGGIDADKQLKVAAQTYRQMGANDFWPGPLDNFGYTDASICAKWNNHFELSKIEVDFFIANPANVTLAIQEWPAKNNPYNTDVGNRSLAPFVDVNGDGDYNTDDGDYPDIVLPGSPTMIVPK